MKKISTGIVNKFESLNCTFLNNRVKFFFQTFIKPNIISTSINTGTVLLHKILRHESFPNTIEGKTLLLLLKDIQVFSENNTS